MLKHIVRTGKNPNYKGQSADNHLPAVLLTLFVLVVSTACRSQLSDTSNFVELSKRQTGGRHRAACRRAIDTSPATAGTGSSSESENTGQQAQIISAQTSHARKVEVVFSATVSKLLNDDTKGLPHQRFLLRLQNGSTVLVAHDIKYAPRVPLSPGDPVTVKGEYIWNERGGVVHWTHHSDTPRHEGGYIDSGTVRYE
jgi:hypothetical protein